MSETPFNLRIDDVTLNYAKLDTPVENPFSKEQQFEVQMVLTDEQAKMIADAGLKVKEKDGVKSMNAVRKAKNGAVKVVGADTQPFEAVRSIGNGTKGNVILWVYQWNNMGRSGVGASLTAVQITDFKEYSPQGSVDFAPVGGESAPAAEGSMF